MNKIYTYDEKGRVDIVRLTNIHIERGYYSGEIEIKRKSISDKILIELQEKLFNMRKENIIRCLDCFLFMISTGQYHSDIMKSKIYISSNGSVTHLRYRRAKNGSLCKAIPIRDDDVFIGRELIEQYKMIVSIRSSTSFVTGRNRLPSSQKINVKQFKDDSSSGTEEGVWIKRQKLLF